MKTYLGYFKHFATGEGATVFLHVFDVGDGEERERKFYGLLCEAAGWPTAPKDDAGFEHVRGGFEFFDTQDQSALETLRGLAGLPVRIEALEHVWFIQRCFCGAPYKLEFFSHVNVS